MALEALVRKFTEDVFDKVDEVHRESFKSVVITANDENVRMPVDTGALQESVAVGGGVDGEGIYLEGKDNISLAVDSAQKFSDYQATWGNEDVDYAAVQEFGTTIAPKIQAKAFVRFALLGWEQEVAKNSQPS